MNLNKQKKTWLLRGALLLMTFSSSIHALADGITVHFPDITLLRDSITEMTVTYNNDVDDIRGFQIEFFLPDGIHLVDASLTDELLRACSGLSLSFRDRRYDNVSIIMVFQFAAKNFPTGELDFLKLQFKADADVEYGTYPVTTSKLLFASYTRDNVDAENQTFNITYSDGQNPDSIDFIKWNAFSSPDGKEDKGFFREGNSIFIPDMMQPDLVRVYTKEGVKVPASIEKSGDGLILSIGDLPKGVFIVDVNGRRTKIVKQ